MVLDAFVVREDLAYAVSAGPDVKLLRWDGSTWSPDPAVLPYEDIRALWADETDVFLVGGTGTVLSLEDDAWRIHDLGSVTDLQAVWGFAGDDVWVVDAERGLHHFDGTSWTDVAWPDRSSDSRCGLGLGTLDLWGVDGTLFLYSPYQLVRHDASGFATLAWWPPEFVPTTETGGYCVGGTTIVRVTGYAPDEVFLAVAVPPEADDTCRTWPLRPFLLRWDGASFHWM